MFEPQERQYVESARVGRLATADAEGRPHVVPVCFAVVDDHVVSPIDEKPQDVSPTELRRSRDVRENPRVSLIVDHYSEDWSELGWVQVRGTATHCGPDHDAHHDGVRALREKYDQYREHDLDARPLVLIAPGTVRSWGRLDHPDRPKRSQ